MSTQFPTLVPHHHFWHHTGSQVPPTDPAAVHPPRSVRIVAGVLLTFTFFASVFAAGEAMDDPGGWKGMLLAAAWLLPMLVLMAVAWLRPVTAERILVGFSVLFATGLLVMGFLGGARQFEHHHGPVRAIVLLALGGVLGVLALHRPRASGMVLTGLAAVVFVAATAAPGSQPLMLVAFPLLITGALLWWLAVR